MFNRFKSLLPRWFGDQTPVLDALLHGLAATARHAHRLIEYARLQTRLQTATGGWLDLIAADFFGDALKRGPDQSDAAFRQRIRARLFGERATRAGLIQALNDLTGREPRVFEPQRIMDTGCYRGPGLAYGLKGGYGSRRRAYQCFVTAYRPRIAGLPFVAGYRIPCGAYKTPSRAAYARRRGLTDADIVDAVNHVKPVGTTVWIRFR
ncbi:conserved hypothetical protein [Candidatus Glomeribacter gigasporarum BEG34]|uniref:Uncharacterized protein n=1 Tax=Candidatus Glomeribacter gigasporarum BEG34 TaxID=1070319 RepID=G2JAZ5_9BURK|nr:hypothetical protein [Candidatus Glomeribacter gigasporarum]CCD29947.1 conserved hypothetical protein [Candidatus Glomeribacter gigasporarum BEG34]